MKNDLYILISILLAFALPLATSLLLDIPWIYNSWPRYILVILLMIAEALLMASIVRKLSKN